MVSHELHKNAPGCVEDAIDAVEILKLKANALDGFQWKPQIAAIEVVLKCLISPEFIEFLQWRQEVKKAVLGFYEQLTDCLSG